VLWQHRMVHSDLGALLERHPSVILDDLATGRVALSVPLAARGPDASTRIEVVARHVTFGSLACADGKIYVRYTALVSAISPERLRSIVELLLAQAKKLSRIWQSVGWNDVLTAD
jgi:hypothetical protein